MFNAFSISKNYFRLPTGPTKDRKRTYATEKDDKKFRATKRAYI